MIWQAWCREFFEESMSQFSAATKTSKSELDGQLDLTWQPGAKPVLQDLGQELRARKGSTKHLQDSKYIILNKDLNK